MQEILGFVVLSMPMLLMSAWLVISILLVVSLRKIFRPGVGRIFKMLAVFFIVLLIPYGDEIVGRAYLEYLCLTKAGVKVYQTVELPAEYWGKEGKPRLFNKPNGNYDFVNIYTTKLNIENISSLLSVDKLTGVYRMEGSNKILAENITYRHWGGWMGKNYGISNTAVTCRNYPKQYEDLTRRVFKPIN